MHGRLNDSGQKNLSLAVLVFQQLQVLLGRLVSIASAREEKEASANRGSIAAEDAGSMLRLSPVLIAAAKQI